MTTDKSLKIEYFTKQTLGRGESQCWEWECSVQKFGAMNKHRLGNKNSKQGGISEENGGS